MTRIAIGNLTEPEETGWLNLNEGAMPEGLSDALWEPGNAGGAELEERITLALHGTHAQLEALLHQLNAFTSAVERERAGRGGSPRYLRAWRDEDSAWYYSRVLAARLEGLPSYLESYAHGSLALALFLRRENHFSSAELALPLSNRSASNTYFPLTLSNHCDGDATHDNFFSIFTPNLAGVDVPAPLRVEIGNPAGQGALGEFYLGGYNLSGAGLQPNLTLQAEAGSGGVSVSSALASGGSYSRYSWSGSAWQSLTSWVVERTTLAQLTGWGLLPLLRFFSLPEEGLRLRLLIGVAGSAALEGPAAVCTAGQGFAALAPIHLPCGQLPGKVYPHAHTLTLQALMPSALNHTLELDDLLLLPDEPYAHFLSAGGLAEGGTLVQDTFASLNYSLLEGQELATHHCLGGGLFLHPGIETRIYAFAAGSDGLALPSRTLTARAFYRKRRRLP